MKDQSSKDKITRKEAISKMGKYAMLTAAGTFFILNPNKAQAFFHRIQESCHGIKRLNSTR